MSDSIGDYEPMLFFWVKLAILFWILSRIDEVLLTPVTAEDMP
jgi:hypothetical protein